MNQKADKSYIGWKLTILICIFILLLAAGAVIFIFSTEPAAVRSGAVKKTAMLVEVSKVQSGTFTPTIVTMGTVIPSRDIILSPRVSGQIIEISKAFTPGGFVQKGQTLLRIDPADFRNALKQRKSELRQALADLKMEMGRQEVAQKEYQALRQSFKVEEDELVLRKPQLDSVQARVEAARAALNQAELDLERTKIKAPFNAHILSQKINLGSQVAAGHNLGRLVGVDTYWIEVTVPLSKLRWLAFPDSQDAKGSKVRIRHLSVWQPEEYRQGHLYKFIGSLEEGTRMAKVLVAVNDPLSLSSGMSDKPALVIGSFVEASIQGKKVADVIRINRDYVRKNDTVWVMQDQKLDIRKIQIVFSDANYAYVKKGLNKDDLVVTTNLATVVEGAGLRVEEPADSSTKDFSAADNSTDSAS